MIASPISSGSKLECLSHRLRIESERDHPGHDDFDTGYACGLRYAAEEIERLHNKDK